MLTFFKAQPADALACFAHIGVVLGNGCHHAADLHHANGQGQAVAGGLHQSRAVLEPSHGCSPAALRSALHDSDGPALSSQYCEGQTSSGHLKTHQGGLVAPCAGCACDAARAIHEVADIQGTAGVYGRGQHLGALAGAAAVARLAHGACKGQQAGAGEQLALGDSIAANIVALVLPGLAQLHGGA